MDRETYPTPDRDDATFSRSSREPQSLKQPERKLKNEEPKEKVLFELTEKDTASGFTTKEPDHPDIPFFELPETDTHTDADREASEERAQLAGSMYETSLTRFELPETEEEVDEKKAQALRDMHGIEKSTSLPPLPPAPEAPQLSSSTERLLRQAKEQFGIDLNLNGDHKKAGFFKRLFGKSQLDAKTRMDVSHIQAELQINYAENQLTNSQLLQKARDVFGIDVEQSGMVSAGFFNRNINKYHRLPDDKKKAFDALLAAVERTNAAEVPTPPRRLSDNRYVGATTAAASLAGAFAAGPAGMMADRQRGVEREFEKNKAEFNQAMSQADLEDMRKHLGESTVDYEVKPFDRSYLHIPEGAEIAASMRPFLTAPGTELDARAQQLLKKHPEGGTLPLAADTEARIIPFGKKGNEVTVYFIDKTTGETVRSAHFVNGKATGELVYSSENKIKRKKGKTDTLHITQLATRSGAVDFQPAEEPAFTATKSHPPAETTSGKKLQASTEDPAARFARSPKTQELAAAQEPAKTPPAKIERKTAPAKGAETKVRSRYQDNSLAAESDLDSPDEMVEESERQYEKQRKLSDREAAKKRMVEYRSSLPEPLQQAYDELTKLGRIVKSDGNIDEKKLAKAREILGSASGQLKLLTNKGRISPQAVHVLKTHWESASPQEVQRIIAEFSVGK